MSFFFFLLHMLKKIASLNLIFGKLRVWLIKMKTGNHNCDAKGRISETLVSCDCHTLVSAPQLTLSSESLFSEKVFSKFN